MLSNRGYERIYLQSKALRLSLLASCFGPTVSVRKFVRQFTTCLLKHWSLVVKNPLSPIFSVKLTFIVDLLNKTGRNDFLKRLFSRWSDLWNRRNLSFLFKWFAALSTASVLLFEGLRRWCLIGLDLERRRLLCWNWWGFEWVEKRNGSVRKFASMSRAPSAQIFSRKF